MNLCSIEGCEKPTVARTWCWPHYQAWRRHGDPLGKAGPRASLLSDEQVLELRRMWAAGELLAEKALEFGVSKSTAYQAATGKTHKHLPMPSGKMPHPGRKRFTDDDIIEIRRLRAEGMTTIELGHRYNYSQAGISSIVRGVTYAHVPLNPAIPAVARRGPRTDGPPKPAITPEQVRAVRQAVPLGAKPEDLAREFDCSEATIKLIVDRKLYAHVED